MNQKVMFSSKTDEWSTPQELFDRLDEEFHFDLDPCATSENHKCEKYYTKEDDGLSQKWGGAWFFATRHMGEPSGTGSGNHMKKQKRAL